MKIADGTNRRRHPGDCPTARQAIRLHCLECVGWNAAEAKRCSAPECWLYLLRGSSYPKALESAARELQLPTDGTFPTDKEAWSSGDEDGGV